MSFPLAQAPVEPLSGFFPPPLDAAVLRLDRIDPVISGNKAFKLKAYLRKARTNSHKTIITFGGAYSNHLVATAAAAQLNGLKSIGIVRGEEPRVWSHTLLAAQDYGMKLVFVSREAYRQKSIPEGLNSLTGKDRAVVIPEGGYGPEGMQGAKEILLQNDTAAYTHIVSAVGTGTTLAGLVAAALPHQHVIGIPVLKNAVSLQDEINRLLPGEKQDSFFLAADYHQGGYAKKSESLFSFMNEFYRETGIPTDFVYTGKAFMAAVDLAQKGFFPSGARVLLVHTGGLQGNGSLKKGTLNFA